MTRLDACASPTPLRAGPPPAGGPRRGARWPAWLVAAALGGALGGVAAAPPVPAPTTPAGARVGADAPRAEAAGGVTELLRRAMVWQSRGRGDLARSTTQKALAAQPDDARALLLMGELELQAGRADAARSLVTRLQLAHPGSAELAELRNLQRLYGPDRDKLAELRQLRRGGRQTEALAAAALVFPDGRPPGALGAEFAPLLGSTPGGWERMRRQLGQRVQQFGAPADRLALYELLGQRNETRAEALRGYAALARSASLPPQTVADAWARAAQPLRPAELQAQRQLIAKALPGARLPPAPEVDPATAPATAAGRAATDGLPGGATAATATARQTAADIGALRDEADALVGQGQLDAARQTLERAVALQPRHAWARHDLARLLLRQDQRDAAAQVMAEGRRLAPNEPEMLHASALIELALDRPTQAVQQLDAIAEARRSESQQRLMQRARFEQALAQGRDALARGDPGEAARWHDRAQAHLERDPERRLRLARAQLASGHGDRVIALLEAQPMDAFGPDLARQREDLLAQARGEGSLLPGGWRSASVELGWLRSSRSGSEGRSTLHAQEIPLRLSWQRAGEQRLSLQVDRLSLDAGPLPAAAGEAEELGQLRRAAADLPAPVPQRDSGAALALGWDRPGEHADLGLMGLGLAVSNWVGGWERRFEQGETRYGVELSRRAETGSLLSWAGAHDPLTGQVWGGVTTTSVAVRASKDLGGAWSGATSLRLGRLAGRHVQSNNALWWRGTLERELLSRADLQASWGLVGAYWQYQHNSGFYTWGHGGYYSPQRYVSVALPVELGGQAGSWRWDLRASLSRSWTREDDSPYFPLDAALQASAGNPQHRGGPGGGVGRSLRAGLETRLGSDWVLGGRIELERSTDYAPNRASLYLRTWFGSGSRDEPRRPQWVAPVSRY